ncbi:hypothetical protein C8R46DRAFT_1217569 [Mycena filopes]|nr:hypothetical protein C8R46DRAFT_1217569 [Mycena filopes]
MEKPATPAALAPKRARHSAAVRMVRGRTSSSSCEPAQPKISPVDPRAQRRPIYISSLEAHIDRLHNQLLGLGLQYYPVPLLELDTFIGLNAKTAKGMIAGLEHDLSRARERLLELQVAVSKVPFECNVV